MLGRLVEAWMAGIANARESRVPAVFAHPLQLVVVLTLAGTLLLIAVMTVTGAVDLIQLGAHGLTLARIQEVISAIPASGVLFGACCVISPRNRSRPVKKSGGKRAARTPPARSNKDEGA